MTVGAEYFFDDSGYRGAEIYPFLLLGGARARRRPARRRSRSATPPRSRRSTWGATTPALFVSLPSPGRWNDTTLTLSVLGNLTDRSAVARLDLSVLALTYLRVEAYVAGRFGGRGGEFRLGFTLPPQTFGRSPRPPSRSTRRRSTPGSRSA